MLLQFPFLPLLHPAYPTTSGKPPTIVHVHGSRLEVLWLLHFLYCTLQPHDYSVTTYLYIIPSSLHPFSHIPLPSDNHQNALCIQDSVSVILVSLVCFLVTIGDRYVFIAILLFIVFIFFFLNMPFNISYNNGLVMKNSFSFLFSGMAFICPSILNYNFTG